MAASNPDFSDYQKFAPPSYEEPQRQHGCFFYGCIIASILTLLLLIAVGVVFFLIYRWAGQMIEEYTATAPRELPKVEMPAEQRRTLKERVEAFRKAIKEGKPTEPLVLNSDEINALIDEEEKFKGKVYVSIDQDKVRGQVSIPLNDIPSLGLTRGRYLNGEAEFKVSLEDGVLIVTLDSFEVNGKKPPPELLAQIAQPEHGQGRLQRRQDGRGDPQPEERRDQGRQADHHGARPHEKAGERQGRAFAPHRNQERESHRPPAPGEAGSEGRGPAGGQEGPRRSAGSGRIPPAASAGARDETPVMTESNWNGPAPRPDPRRFELPRVE